MGVSHDSFFPLYDNTYTCPPLPFTTSPVEVVNFICNVLFLLKENIFRVFTFPIARTVVLNLGCTLELPEVLLEIPILRLYSTHIITDDVIIIVIP